MGDLTAEQSILHCDLKHLLKEMKSRCASQKGWLRWNLEKKVETDPSCSSSLICVLVTELEKKLKKIHEKRSHMHIIPILHTLYYAVMQSSSTVPTSLYHRVCRCLVKLLILPLPYSAVALSTLSSIRMEMTTPGSLYQRRITAEQNLRSKTVAFQEKVFVLADPAVFSAQLEERLRAYLEVSGMFGDTTSTQRSVMMRVLQKGLGTCCQSSRLARALEVLDQQMVERHFEEVALAVEQSVKHGAGGGEAYLNRLQHVQREILTAAKQETSEEDGGSVCSAAMAFPEIELIVWNNEEDLWSLLANFTLRSCSYSSTDEDSLEDSRIQRNLTERRNAFRKTKSAHAFVTLMRDKMEAVPGSSPALGQERRCRTARVVALGDDRVLGRLGEAFHSIREKESKHLILTKKLNLQLYYIPVASLGSPDVPCEDEGRMSLASLLGRVDPWYNSNINSLTETFSNLAGKHYNERAASEQNIFLLDSLSYYLRCGTQPVHLPLYSAKMTRSSCDGTSVVVEEVFVCHLEANIPEFKHLKEMVSKEPSTRRKKSTVEVYGAVITASFTESSLSKRKVTRGEAPMACGVVITSMPAAITTGQDYLTVSFDTINPGHNTIIKTQNISIKTMEHRALSVCLDKDPRRTYADVQRIEISPCLDPGCSIRSKLNVSTERELPLYLSKVLSLPINTFTGVTL